MAVVVDNRTGTLREAGHVRAQYPAAREVWMIGQPTTFDVARDQHGRIANVTEAV